MRKCIINFLFMAFVVVAPVCGQTVTDSVRIKLETSPGAEIGIDGDVSSTNLMRKKVPVGEHTVIVTYGTSYKKEYTIDGKLSIKTVPSSVRVYVDGMERGKAPLTIGVLGTHNLRLVPSDRATYFDYTDRVTVNPFQQMEQTFMLSKRPPRTYGMVLADYMPISGTGAVGLTLACVKRWGMYVRATLGLNGCGGFEEEVGNWYGGYEWTAREYFQLKHLLAQTSGPGVYKKSRTHYWDVNAGFIVRTCKYLYLYVGAGYGQHSLKYKKGSWSSDSDAYALQSRGVMVDGGAILKWRALLLQAGYNRMVTSNSKDMGDKFGSVYFGLGFTIHKQKKDK